SRDERHPPRVGRPAARRAARAAGADRARAPRARAGEHARRLAALQLARVGAERCGGAARREVDDARGPNAQVPNHAAAHRGARLIHTPPCLPTARLLYVPTALITITKARAAAFAAPSGI